MPGYNSFEAVKVDLKKQQQPKKSYSEVIHFCKIFLLFEIFDKVFEFFGFKKYQISLTSHQDTTSKLSNEYFQLLDSDKIIELIWNN